MQLTMPSDEEFFVALDKAVASKAEGYVYSNPLPEEFQLAPCMYVHEGCPGCLIGTMFHNLGVPLDMMVERYTVGFMLDYLYNPERESRRCFQILGSPIRKTLDFIQSAQDCRYPWGEAVRTGRIFYQVVCEGDES